MRRLLLPLLLALGLQAEDRWLEVRSGPFQVFSAAGDKAAREQMAELEQFRHALGTALGKPDLHLVWPVKILVNKGGAARAGVALGRDAYMTAALDAPARAQLAQLFIEQNTSRLPADIERGLVDLFSTLQVSGTHIVLGTPPASSARNRDWARMHLLNVDGAYAGRSRVLINNLEQGSDLDAAYRNAYEKSVAQIEKHVDAYLAAGNFGATTVSARPLSPVRDLHVKPASPDQVNLAQADLLFTAGAYNNLHGAEAAEGLGLIALAANRKNEAKQLFESAMQSGSKNARIFYEAARLESDPAKARKELHQAMELNPAWAEPPYQLALLESDLDVKAALFKKATILDPRQAGYWQALAKNEAEAMRFIEAQKAWGGAERAAANPQERERIRQVRLQLQGERADQEAAERRRKAEEEARDLERVKNLTLDSIHQAEAAARKKLNPNGEVPPAATEWWSDSDGKSKVEGSLQRFDCIGRQARLVLHTPEGQDVQLLVRDPSQIVLSGQGEMTLGCGPQKPTRKVLVLYNPKPDKRLGTAGEATNIEFR